MRDAVILAALYVAVARLGLSVDAIGGFATLVWPAAGLALAALLLRGVHLWSGIYVGAFLVNLWAGASVPVAAAIAAGNTLEAVAAWMVLRRLGFQRELTRVRDVLLLLGTAFGSTLIAATIGVASLLASGTIGEDVALAAWRAWWLGDAIGVVVIAPVFLAWVPAIARGVPPRRLPEVLALAAAIVGCAIYVFADVFPGAPTPLRYPYILFPLLIIAALRFDLRGAATATFAICAVAVIGTAQGHGPFVQASVHESLLYLQVFISVAASTALVLGAASLERRAAIEMRDEFLSVASHELRTPLTALALQLDELQRTVDVDASDPRVPVKIDRAVRATDRLAGLVENLLDVSRVTTGLLVLHREACDLSEIARDVADRFAEQARRVGTELTVRADGVVAGSWDRLRLEQVLGNLLANALKYGPGSPIEIQVTAAAGHARLVVGDRGIGIAGDAIERIFGRFERAVPLTHYGGLGLGLYIVRRVVEVHGGRITAASTPGQGSTFTVELPQE